MWTWFTHFFGLLRRVSRFCAIAACTRLRLRVPSGGLLDYPCSNVTALTFVIFDV
jgi:hypothetical protein